jgi:hypothetical protein
MIFTKKQVLVIVQRAYGPDAAASVADRLPARIDPDDPKDAELLRRLGLSRDSLFDALGAEL